MIFLQQYGDWGRWLNGVRRILNWLLDGYIMPTAGRRHWVNNANRDTVMRMTLKVESNNSDETHLLRSLVCSVPGVRHVSSR
jgi:hypothetical protein